MVAVDGRPMVATARRLVEHKADALWAGAEAARREIGAESILCAVDEDVEIDAPRGIRIVRLPAIVRSGDAAELLADVPGAEGAVVVRATDLVARAGGGRWVTVAGAVREPEVRALPPGATVADLVATDEIAWVALAGGPLGGDPLAPPEAVPERTDALWVVRAGSDLARRARRPLPAVVREALSACEGCRACTDVCPPHLLGRALQPDRIVRALAHGLEPPPGAGACVGCSICDLVCPAGLTPRRVVGTLPRTEGEDGPPSPDRDLRRVAMNVALVRLGISPETPLPRWAASP